MTNQKPRALIFSTAYFPLVGGAEIALREITNQLPGWELDLICARIRPGLASREVIGNITVHRVGFGHPVDKYLLPFFGAWKGLWMRPRPDVIWSLLASYNGFAALFYCWLRPRSRLLLTLQEGDPLEHYAKRVGWLQGLHQAVFRRADRVQAISVFLADWAKRMGFSGTPDVIPNGVDIPRFIVPMTSDRRAELRRELGYGEEDVVLITTSRLSLKNGVDDLIRSLRFLPERVKALVVGDGEDRKKLEVLVEEKGLSARVQFLGLRPHEALPELLKASDIFIRPSLSEGLGISFLEAMVAGLPIIGTPVGGIPDFLVDGKTGVFCKPRDPESVAQAVKRLLEDSSLRDRIVSQGIELVKSSYAWDEIAKRMDGLLRSLLV